MKKAAKKKKPWLEAVQIQIQKKTAVIRTTIAKCQITSLECCE